MVSVVQYMVFELEESAFCVREQSGFRVENQFGVLGERSVVCARKQCIT